MNPQTHKRRLMIKVCQNTRIINSKREKERFARKENPKQTQVWLMTQVRIAKEHQVINQEKMKMEMINKIALKLLYLQNHPIFSSTLRKRI